MSLRIAHTAANLVNLSAGPSHSIPGLAAAQARLGASVALHSVGGAPVHVAERLADHRHHNDLAKLPFFRHLSVSAEMRRAVAENRSEIVHTHGLWRAPNLYRPPGVPFVIAPMGMLAPSALAFSALQKRLFLVAGQGVTLRAANLFHATSELEYTDIRRFGLRQPVALIPNGVEIQPLSPRAPSPRRTLLSLGRLHPIKGLDTLLHAWARVEAQLSEWDLRIVGPDEGGHRAELVELSQRLGLQRVTIGEPVHGAARDALMASADLFVLPSRSENFAMTVAESLAAAVPVISSKGAPWQGLSTHGCGWWIDHGEQSLAQTLLAAASLSVAERTAMGARGRAWMQQDFSWDRMAAMALEAYAWLLGRGSRPPFVAVD